MVGGWTYSKAARSRTRVIASLVVGFGAIVAVLWLPWPAVLVPAAFALVAVAVLDRRQIRALGNKWFLAGLTLSVILPVWLLGAPPELEVHGDVPRIAGETCGVEAGHAALIAGATMAVRVTTTVAVFLLIGGSLTPTVVSRMLGKVVGKELGLACAVGVNLLPSILEILRRTALAMRLRGGLLRHRFANARRLLTTVGVQTVRLTEDVAEALLLAEPAESAESVDPAELAEPAESAESAERELDKLTDERRLEQQETTT